MLSRNVMTAVLGLALCEAVQGDAAAGGAPAAPAKKAKAEVEKVSMSDGRTVDFAGKAKVLKEGLVKMHDGSLKPVDELSEDELGNTHVGQVHVRMDFRNGTTRLYPLNPKLGLRFAAHGALQKYGDQLAGEDAPDLDDWAESVDKLHEQLHKNGEWAKARVGGGMAGTSVLVQALSEFTGKTVDEVRAFIKDWSQSEKLAMRNDEDIKPIIARIEAEKAAKAGNVDTSKLKAGLKGLLGSGDQQAAA